MGKAPDDESPRRLTRRRTIVLAVVGSLVVVGLAVGVAVWQLRDPPTLTEQVAAVPGISEDAAASMVDHLQSDPEAMDLINSHCAMGTSARGYAARAAAGAIPEFRAAATAAAEVVYKYYCPQAPSS